MGLFSGPHASCGVPVLLRSTGLTSLMQFRRLVQMELCQRAFQEVLLRLGGAAGMMGFIVLDYNIDIVLIRILHL